MGATVGPASGSRATIEVTPENKYGRLRTGKDVGTYGVAIPFTSESIKSSMNELVSATLTPQRAVADSVRGAFDVAGDISFELRPQGHHQLIKAAMGDGASGSKNYVKVANCRGDLGVQADGYHATAAVPWTVNVKCDREILEDWIDLWTAEPAAQCDLVHIRRDAAGLLVANAEKWDLIDGGTALGLFGTEGDPYYRHQIGGKAGGAALAAAVYDNSWIFPVDAAHLAGAYLHYLELGANLVNGMNIDILRDFALFVYTGMKVNTWTLNLNANEIVNGTFGFIGKAEYIGGELTAELTNDTTGPVNVVFSDLRIFNNWPGLAAGNPTTCKMMVGGEGNIAYAGTGITATLYANLDIDSYMENPFPGTIRTTTGTVGGVAMGTDMVGAGPWGPWPTAYGWFIGQPVVASTSRANTGAVPKDLQALIVDVPPFTYFEARAEMSTGLTGGTVSRDQGLEFTEVMSANFTIDNGIYTDKYALGDKFRKMAPEQLRNVTGTLSMEFDDMRQYHKFFKGTPFSLIFRVISEDAAKGLVPNCSYLCPYSICFYFRKCKYTGDTPNVGDSGIIVYDQPFRASNYVGVVDTVTPYYDKAFTELAVWMTNAINSEALWA